MEKKIRQVVLLYSATFMGAVLNFIASKVNTDFLTPSEYGDVRYVLHRVWKKTGDTYVCLGDNCVNAERNVRLEDIMGILTEVNRKGKIIHMTDPGYRFYVWFWGVTRPVRIFCKKCRIKAVRLAKRILRRV